MISSQLPWQALRPNTDDYRTAFTRIPDTEGDIQAAIQPRLINGLAYLDNQTLSPVLMVRSQENTDYLSRIAAAYLAVSENNGDFSGWNYQRQADDRFLLVPAAPGDAVFCQQPGVFFREWIESTELFGAVRGHAGDYRPEPGLLHQANGGTLILSVRTLLAQPLMWLRLKQYLARGYFQWLSADERRPLPVSLPDLPLNIKLILCGDRDALAEFQESEPEFVARALYTEYEEQWRFSDNDDMALWCGWVTCLSQELNLPDIAEDSWPLLVTEGCRYTGDQTLLPLCPHWIQRQLTDAVSYGGEICARTLRGALEARRWRESYLPGRMQDEINDQQVFIETEGEVIGQVNGLSVLDFPGHPRPWGEPSRITCVVHYGDGEVMDIERKAELGGNLHAKGMMIIQAFLISELELDQQLPFSASMVFEQSYSEVDGDSASLAELCALVSALALQPLTQSIAVTGSIDQLGNVQPVGGLNEKIEGFFGVCSARELTGKQGVVIPRSNVRHLSLSDEVTEAVKAGQFHLWAVDSADQALTLLTGKQWLTEDDSDDLISLIQRRIAQATQPEHSSRTGVLRWLNWFNQR